MTRKITVIFLMLYLLINNAVSQSYNFESGSLLPFKLFNSQSGTLSIANAPYKDGTHSLKWDWTSASDILIDYSVTNNNFRDGVIFWVYNETPRNAPLRCEYKDNNQTVQYYFDFGLNFKGWRICRIGSKYMLGPKLVSSGLKLHLKSPVGVSQGTLYIDRFSFVSDVNYQNAPDAQLPNNTESAYIGHWNALWLWESTLKYDIAAPSSLTTEQIQSVNAFLTALNTLFPVAAQSSVISSAKSLFASAGITKSGNFLVGAPFVLKPDKNTGEIALAEMGTILYGLAQDYIYNQVALSKDDFLLAWDYAVDQGFAWGSAMGNNNHYGYEARQMFLAAYLMRDVLKETGRLNEAVAAISFWSGLPETRAAFDPQMNGIVDSWNTLLLPRIIAAAMTFNPNERYRNIQSLVRWVDQSLFPTEGNLGGIKLDGSVFHHAGAYPAYAVGGFSGLSDFFTCINPSSFKVSVEDRKFLADALISMVRYSNFKDWSIGMSGRHPFDGEISQGTMDAIGYLALSGGIYNPTETIDSRLGAEYLRLQPTGKLVSQIQTVTTPATDPQGFFVYNHAALGVLRLYKTMVSIKGYNSDVWSSEIYTANNRYGRYQSYGAVEILNEGSPVTRIGSRFNENGWDWNRLPGTTTIHLPFDLLESPVTSTLMARSKEDFAGASSLNNTFGIFGMKLWEQNTINNTNFTPDFKARKSVFAFGKRLICIGTNITNSNVNYPTETTLFQNSLNSTSETVYFDGNYVNAYTSNSNVSKTSPVLLSDAVGNYYRVASGTNLYLKGGSQNSYANADKSLTQGNFVAAWIDHGVKPLNKAYEYMIMLKPSQTELSAWNSAPNYTLIQCDSFAHIVKDLETNVTGYVCFKNTAPTVGNLLSCTEETLVLMKETNSSISMSVCDPSLHLPVKTVNSTETSSVSEVRIKQLLIKGGWTTSGNPLVTATPQNGNTLLSVTCQYGIPVEFNLQNSTDVKQTKTSSIKIYKNGNQIILKDFTDGVEIFTPDGKLIYQNKAPAEKRAVSLEKQNTYLVRISISGKTETQKIIL